MLDRLAGGAGCVSCRMSHAEFETECCLINCYTAKDSVQYTPFCTRRRMNEQASGAFDNAQST